jgi:hypothetical protein
MPFSISGLLSSLNRYQSLIVWCVCEVNFVLFKSMLKYVINRLMHFFFHIRTVIIPRPISTLGLKPSGRYLSLGMITVLIWKRACINLQVIYLDVNSMSIIYDKDVSHKLVMRFTIFFFFQYFRKQLQ